MPQTESNRCWQEAKTYNKSRHSLPALDEGLSNKRGTDQEFSDMQSNSVKNREKEIAARGIRVGCFVVVTGKNKKYEVESIDESNFLRLVGVERRCSPYNYELAS